MSRILVESVSIDFPLTSARDRSLKNTALSRVTKIGGRVVDRAETSVVRALDSVNFTLKDGDRLGLYGPNGAGKTTLIRTIAGIYAPTYGRLVVEGRLLPLFDIVTGVDEESTGYENIFIRGLIMGLSEKEIKAKTAEIAEFSELGFYLDFPIRTYSTGMMLRLMFSIATAVPGDIILMDEWLTVGDQQFKFKAQERLIAMTEQTGILVLASQEERMLRQFCNVALRLEGGRVVQFGPVDEVLGAAA